MSSDLSFYTSEAFWTRLFFITDNPWVMHLVSVLLWFWSSEWCQRPLRFSNWLTVVPFISYVLWEHLLVSCAENCDRLKIHVGNMSLVLKLFFVAWKDQNTTNKKVSHRLLWAKNIVLFHRWAILPDTVHIWTTRGMIGYLVINITVIAWAESCSLINDSTWFYSLRIGPIKYNAIFIIQAYVLLVKPPTLW